MGFWWGMFGCSLLTPLIMLAAGRAMWRHCPKQINSGIGYRTRRSMKNLDTWRFAHTYCGRLWWKWGWFMLLPAALIQLPFIHRDAGTIGNVCGALITIQCGMLLISVWLTERALKRTFPGDGKSEQRPR